MIPVLEYKRPLVYCDGGLFRNIKVYNDVKNNALIFVPMDYEQSFKLTFEEKIKNGYMRENEV